MATTPIKHDASTDIYRGQLHLFLGGLPLAFSSTATLEVTAETIDASNKMTGSWNVSIPGKKSFTLTSEALYTQKEGTMSFDTLLQAMIDDTLLDFQFSEAKATETDAWGGKFEPATTGKKYTGKVMVTSINLQSENGQLAKSSITLNGVGALASGGSGSSSGGGGGQGGGSDDGEL